MFEGDTNIGLLNVARNNQFQANQNAKQSEINLQSALKWRAHAQGLEAKVAELQAEVVKFRNLAIQNLAHSEGYKVMYDAMKAAHPTSPMLVDSGKRYKDGDIKVKSRLLYEEAFDRIITDHDISNPVALRAD